MRKREFNIKLWKENESSLFVITCDKPDVASQGKTLKEAFMMIGDAIELVENTNQEQDTLEEKNNGNTFRKR